MEHESKFVGIVFNKKQLLLGIVVLILGSLIYLVDRPPEYTYFVHFFNNRLSFFNLIPNLFGTLGYYLPALFHAFSLILITAALIEQNNRKYFATCLAWLSIETVFEMGQAFGMSVSRIIPDFFYAIPFFENTKNYFLQGTFDFFDLFAAITGSVLAYLALLATTKREKPIEKF